MRIRGFVVTLVAMTMVAGCAGRITRIDREVRVTEGFAAPGTAYGKALARYTSRAELYEGFDTIAKGTATWRSAELRRALAEASVEAYELQGEAAESLRREEERASAGMREFHLSLYTSVDGWNDLESPDTLWKIYLELPGGDRLDPVRVERLAKSDQAPVEYPYITPWSQEYSLFFPVVGEEERADPVALVLTGPLGTLRFEY